MGDDSTIYRDGQTFLFHHLVAMFQTLALQQLGKFVSPITGKLERDLQQARITIDMLQMLRDKTAGNLTDDEVSLLDRILWELQMNFVDERRRMEEEERRKAGEEEEEEPASEAERSAGGEKEQSPEGEHTGEPAAEKAGRGKRRAGTARTGKKKAPKRSSGEASARGKKSNTEK